MPLHPMYRPSSSEFPNDNPACQYGALWVGSHLCIPPAEPLAIEESDLLAELGAELTPAAESQPLSLDSRELERVEPVVVELFVCAPAPVVPAPAPVVLAAPARVVPAAPAPVVPAPVVEPAPRSLVGAPALLEALLDPTNAEPVAIPEPEPKAIGAPTAFVRFTDAVIDVAKGYMSARLAQKTRDLLLEGAPGADLDDECRDALRRAQVLDGGAVSTSFQSARIAFHALLDGDSSDMNGCGEQTLDQWATDLIAALSNRPSEAAAIRRALRKHKIAAFGMLD